MIILRSFRLINLSVALLLAGCGGSSGGDDDDNNSNVPPYSPVSEYTPEIGRLLASQCFQCHGTNGNSSNDWDSIAGESVSETVEEMLDFKSGDEDEPIMEAQAHGYNYTEITELAEWLATQSNSEEED